MKNIETAGGLQGEAKDSAFAGTKPFKLIAFGNALLDISVRIDSDEILKRYNFGPNEQGELQQEMLDNVIRDVRNQ